MKCKYCGADLTMEDEVCPFCHNPNPYYVKHREDMHRYEQDYQETKSDVYETAGKTSRKATQIAILAVLGGLFLGTVVLNTNIWTVERMIQRHKIRNNISTHLAKLDQYLAEEDWASFTDYIDMNQLYYSGIDELEDYRYFRQLADDYNYIYESCMHLVDYENLDEDEYYIADLLGMKVLLEDGSEFGTLKNVMETGANDVYIVDRMDGEEILLPAIHDCVLDVDVEKNTMTVHLMKGLV